MNASCRACLSQEVHLYTNEETENNEILSGLLNTFTALTGFETHPIFLGGVFNLCEPCEAKLKLCNEFREMCLQSYTQLGQQFLKVEVDNDEEIALENFNIFELSKEEFGDSVVNDEIETVENFDCSHEDQVATISSNKRLEKYSAESIKTLIDELNNKLSELRMCVSCNYIAVKCVDLQQHMVKEHPNLNDNWCNKCNQLFDPSLEHEHRENILICKLCGKIAKNRSHLLIHYQAHTDNQKYDCDQCDKSYVTKSGLQTHYNLHTNVSYKCKFCPQTYNRSTSLRRHLTKHTQGDLQNDCKICNKSFNNHEDLDNHDCEVVNPNDVSESSLVETIFRDPVINEEIKMVEIFDTKIVKHEDIVSTVTNNKRSEKNSKEIALKGGKKFSCDKCDRSYTTKSNLNEHYKSHIIQSYACQFCPNTYKLERSLRRHLLAHSHQVECETCKKKFDNQEDLENHDCINEVINPNEVSENSLVETEAVFNEEIEMKEIFDSKIANHEDKVSMITNNQDSDTNSKESALKGGKKFSCDKCDKSYTTKGNLNEHYKSHTISSYPCQFCPNTYKLERSLRRHLIAHTHQVECETCKKRFENEEDLENHDCTIQPKNLNKMPENTPAKSKTRRIISSTNKYYLCSICGKQLCSVANLKMHMDIHTGVKPFKCRHCDFRTRLKDILVSHERRHTGEKPFQCNICQKTFSQRGSLSLHVKTHQGDLGKPFPCLLCEKRYVRKIDLQYHMRFHTGEKPFRCNLCPKAFKRSIHLKYHLDVHSDARPYICAYCGEGFKARNTLKNHELIHKGEKPYKCEICKYDFRKAGHLKVHMKQHNQ